MQSARASALSTRSALTKPGHVERLRRGRAESAAAAPPRAPGRRRGSRRAAPGCARAPAASAGTSAGTRFSGMWRPANTTSGSAGAGSRASSGPAYSPSSTVSSPFTAASRRRRRVQPREAERALRERAGRATARPRRCDRPRGRGTRASSRGSRPRASRPPAGSGASGRSERRRQQREVRERGRVHDVVAAPVAQQVPEHAGAEHERRQDAPAAARRVELHARARRHHAHARYVGALAAVPLAQREVGDLVPVRGEPLAEVAVPALGAADGVREQAVVDEADRAWRRQRLADRCATIAAQRATSSVSARSYALQRTAFEARSPEHRSSSTTRPPSIDGEGSTAVKVSVVIPCLNEAATIERCVADARDGARGPGLAGRGRSSPTTAPTTAAPSSRAAAGARGGARAAARLRQRLPAPASPPRAGDYIVMADADLTYDFGDIPRFVDEARRAAPTS